VPVVAALVVAFAILVGGRTEVKTSTAAPRVRDAAGPRDGRSAAPLPEPPPLIAPVVIAPPEPVVEEPVDAGPAGAGRGPKGVRTAPKRP
jgi:hypothetical protein